jgi:hypothetical protein
MLIERKPPATVTRALRLLLAYVLLKVLLTALGMIGAYSENFAWDSASMQAKEAIEILVALIFAWIIGFYGLIIWKLKKGRSWPKYVLASVFPLTVAIEIYGDIAHAEEVGRIAITNADIVSGVITIMPAYAIYLLFARPSIVWFRSDSKK